MDSPHFASVLTFRCPYSCLSYPQLQSMMCLRAQVLSPSHVRMHVWERGAGATLACGTGACATVVAGVLEGRLDRVCRCSCQESHLPSQLGGLPLPCPMRSWEFRHFDTRRSPRACCAYVQGGPARWPLTDRVARSRQPCLHDRTSIASLCRQHGIEITAQSCSVSSQAMICAGAACSMQYF